MKLKYVLIWTIALFAYNNLHAQYTLELDWQKELGGKLYNINTITKSDNDSLIYIAGANNLNFENKSIYVINSADGSTLFTKPTPWLLSKMIMSRNGKVLTVSSNDYSFVGTLDPSNFEVSSSFTFGNISDHSYNEQQNKIVACGISTIRIYDLNTKTMVKEFNADYFKNNELYIWQANLTDNGKYIVYSVAAIVDNKYEYYLRIIDLEGKEVINFGKVGNEKFGFTYDGSQLIYFKNNNANFYDVNTLQSKESIFINTTGATTIETSNNGKLIYFGGGGLFYIDLETKKTVILNDLGGFIKFKLNSDNSNIVSGSGKYLQRFNIKPVNSILTEPNNLGISLATNGNELVVKFPNENYHNLNFRILTIDGKLQRQVLPNATISDNGNIKINISDLAIGTYLLQIQDGNSIISTLKFLKVD